MVSFRVEDMTCSGCAASITRAVQSALPRAGVAVDLAHHLVSIEAAGASAAELEALIRDAGFSPVPAG